MLVLSRKAKQSIVIADSIEVSVLDVRGGRVKLGIRCPREIPVHRQEVWEELANVPETLQPRPGTEHRSVEKGVRLLLPGAGSLREITVAKGA